MTRIIDISMAVYTGMPSYPGDPGAEVRQTRFISKGHVANLSELRLGSHTGTHIDAPRHFEAGRDTVDELNPEILMGPALVLDFSEATKDITRVDLERQDIRGIDRVLLKTSNSELLSLPDFSEDYIALAGDAAEYLVHLGVLLVGIDYLSIESYKSDEYPTHHTLLGAGVVVLEGVDLSEAEAGLYELVCLPIKVKGGDGAPARAILIDSND